MKFAPLELLVLLLIVEDERLSNGMDKRQA